MFNELKNQIERFFSLSISLFSLIQYHCLLTFASEKKEINENLP